MLICDFVNVRYDTCDGKVLRLIFGTLPSFLKSFPHCIISIEGELDCNLLWEVEEKIPIRIIKEVEVMSIETYVSFK